MLISVVHGNCNETGVDARAAGALALPSAAGERQLLANEAAAFGLHDLAQRCRRPRIEQSGPSQTNPRIENVGRISVVHGVV